MMPPIRLVEGQFELQVLGQFLDVYLPKPISPLRSQADSWKDTIARMGSTNPLLKRTTVALGLSCVGDRIADETLRRQGAKLYGAVLLQLNEILRHPKDTVIDGNVVTAILLMGVYEQFNGFSVADGRNQSRGWQAHVLGMKKLFGMQGPQAFIDEQEFIVFQACQYSQFTSAFMIRKDTPMASVQWRTIPWTGRQKDQRDLFFDTIYPLLGLAEKAQEAHTLNHGKVVKLITRLFQFYLEIDSWKKAVTQEPDTGLSQLISTIGGSTSHGIDILYTQAFDMLELQTSLLFCSVILHTTILINDMLAQLPDEHRIFGAFGLQETLPYALWILQAIPTSVRYGGINGSQSVLFPLGAVRWYIRHAVGTNPDVARSLAASVKDATREMGYLLYMDSFLNSIPTSRIEPLLTS
jgi:hypothetical protein